MESREIISILFCSTLVNKFILATEWAEYEKKANMQQCLLQRLVPFPWIFVV